MQVLSTTAYGLPGTIPVSKNYELPKSKPIDLPLRKWGLKPGDRIGIIGTGRLSQLAVLQAAAMGANVTVITDKEEKRMEILQPGVDNVLVSTDEDGMKVMERSFDYLLCSTQETLDLNIFLGLLKPLGSIGRIGYPSIKE